MNDFQAFETALAEYVAFIKADYAKASPTSPPMIVELEYGQKFIRVVVRTYGSGSAHSFIALTDSGFYKTTRSPIKRGDVLKCAGYKAPAKNYRRASLFIPEIWHRNVHWMSAS